MKQDLLARLQRMGDDQLYQELYQDPLTNCLNRRAYDLLQASPVAIVDLDSLKYINDIVDHRHGDALLIRLAQMLVRAFEHGDVYRLSGDEFLVVNGSATKLHCELTKLQQAEPYFSFGAGQDLVAADNRLQIDKYRREQAGTRAARGERPPWFEEIMRCS